MKPYSYINYDSSNKTPLIYYIFKLLSGSKYFTKSKNLIQFYFQMRHNALLVVENTSKRTNLITYLKKGTK